VIASALADDDPVSERERMTEEVLIRLERLCEWMRRDRIANRAASVDASMLPASSDALEPAR
jgi:hypothetical protein